MKHDNRPVGIFDSGVGGLTVVSEVIKELPNENIIYFGDTARVPYGSKSSETITKFSRQIVRFLIGHDVKAVVVACNTISSNSYTQLVDAFDLPIIEVVTPGATSGAAATRNKLVGLIGTEMTVKSGAYHQCINSIDPEISVFSKACPLFVPLAEEGWTDNEIAALTAKAYIDELLEKGIDTLILGCTHYPLLLNCITAAAGENVRIVNPAKATAQLLEQRLSQENLLADSRGQKGTCLFYVSDNTAKFDDVCRRALGSVYPAEKIDIEQY